MIVLDQDRVVEDPCQGWLVAHSGFLPRLFRGGENRGGLYPVSRMRQLVCATLWLRRRARVLLHSERRWRKLRRLCVHIRGTLRALPFTIADRSVCGQRFAVAVEQADDLRHRFPRGYVCRLRELIGSQAIGYALVAWLSDRDTQAFSGYITDSFMSSVRARRIR